MAEAQPRRGAATQAEHKRQAVENFARVFATAGSEDPELQEQGRYLIGEIERAVDRTPEYGGLFAALAGYITRLQSRNGTRTAVVVDSTSAADAPASKKRRRDEVEAEESKPAVKNEGDGQDQVNGHAPTVLDLGEDVSFSVPVRKKLKLECTTEEMRGRNPANSNVECRVRWRDIEQIICVPVPEKTTRQLNFCVFPQYASGGVAPVPEGKTATEALVWTIPDAAPKEPGNVVLGAGFEEVDKGSYKSILTGVLNGCLPKGVKVIEPDEKEFSSALVQAHRKGEKAAHVKAFRGSKEGYLFFLPTGILWAFKKPLLFFSFPDIASISYTSVLQRTFNLNIATNQTSEDSTPSQDFEFAMIDQADYPGIDEYVRAHALQDASMAEQRKARRVNINPPVEGEGEDGDKELDKAFKEMKEIKGEDEDEVEGPEGGAADEEDEEEEDYDPGSEGESEGEGSDTSGEEQEDDEGGGDDDGEDEGDDEDL
ncbi:MAG: hypothetical protein M4579_005565 [Chaenotheca gracillima]|nr:MAG: hypothetical protein M4579_005565 [Chaenotheca gracillima]